MKIVPLLFISGLVLTGCGGSDGGSSQSVAGSANSNSGDYVNNPTSDSGSTVTAPTTEAPQSNDFSDLMLYAVNQARATQQNCGGEMMPAVPALTWDYSLESAAFNHSSDMANVDFMDHTGSDGSSPGDRISATGYQFSAWAENVAAGQKDIDSVMAAWLSSPGHCKNIMSSSVTQMGAAAVENPDTRYGIYWTQVFARPR